MRLVVDTSILVAVLVSEPERERIIALTQNAELMAPQSVHWEIGNALSAMIKRRRVTIPQAMQALEAYEKIPIRLVETSLHDALAVAGARGLYAYDAYLITCARDQRCALMSLDRTLLREAEESGVAIVEVPET